MIKTPKLGFYHQLGEWLSLSCLFHLNAEKRFLIYARGLALPSSGWSSPTYRTGSSGQLDMAIGVSDYRRSRHSFGGAASSNETHLILFLPPPHKHLLEPTKTELYLALQPNLGKYIDWRGTKSVSLQIGFSEKMQEPQLWQTDKTLEIQQLGSDIFKQAALRGLARGKTMPFDHPTKR